jgi:hypothetical protein
VAALPRRWHYQACGSRSFTVGWKAAAGRVIAPSWTGRGGVARRGR